MIYLLSFYTAHFADLSHVPLVFLKHAFTYQMVRKSKPFRRSVIKNYLEVGRRKLGGPVKSLR